jgi:[acyl-carrier-protein] S-malonyltransferase
LDVLGEYSALCFAGVFSFEDGVRLTKARGEAMQSACDRCESGMVSFTGLNPETVAQICQEVEHNIGEVVGIANYLSPTQVVIGGTKLACFKASEIAQQRGVTKLTTLPVAGAFHTQLMRPAEEVFRSVLNAAAFSEPKIPVVSNVDALVHTNPQRIRQALLAQISRPVQWQQTMEFLSTYSPSSTENELLNDVNSPSLRGSPGAQIRAYEVGPGTTCAAILKKMYRKAQVTCISV